MVMLIDTERITLVEPDEMDGKYHLIHWKADVPGEDLKVLHDYVIDKRTAVILLLVHGSTLAADADYEGEE